MNWKKFIFKNGDDGTETVEELGLSQNKPIDSNEQIGQLNKEIESHIFSNLSKISNDFTKFMQLVEQMSSNASITDKGAYNAALISLKSQNVDFNSIMDGLAAILNILSSEESAFVKKLDEIHSITSQEKQLEINKKTLDENIEEINRCTSANQALESENETLLLEIEQITKKRKHLLNDFKFTRDNIQQNFLTTRHKIQEFLGGNSDG